MEEKTIVIPVKKLELLTFVGYMQAFYNTYLPEADGQHFTAYEALEKDLHKTFGINRYKKLRKFPTNETSLYKSKIQKKKK